MKQNRKKKAKNSRSTRRQTRKTNRGSTRRQTRKNNRRSTRRKTNRRYSKRKTIKKNINSLYGGDQGPEDGYEKWEDKGEGEDDDDDDIKTIVIPEYESGEGTSVYDKVEDESVDVEDGLVDVEVEDEPSTEQREWWTPFLSMTELNDAFEKMSENKMFFTIFEKPVSYVPSDSHPPNTLVEITIQNKDRNKLFESYGVTIEEYEGEKYVDIFDTREDLREIYENVLTHSEKELLKYRYDNMIFIEENFLERLSGKDKVEANIRKRIKGDYTPVQGKRGVLADPVVMFQWHGKSDKLRELLPIRLRKLNVERQENDNIKLLNKFYHDRTILKTLAIEDKSDERSISSYLSTLNLYEQIVLIKGIVYSLYTDGQKITYDEKEDIMEEYNEIYRDEERGKEKYNFDRGISKMISEAEREITDKIKLILFPKTDKKRCKEYAGYEGKKTTNKVICDFIKDGEEDLNKLFDRVEINLGGYFSSEFTFDDNHLFNIDRDLIKEIVNRLVEEQYRKTKLFSSLNLDPETKEGREEITIRINQLNSEIKGKLRIKEKTGKGDNEIITLEKKRDDLISLRGENDPEIKEVMKGVNTYPENIDLEERALAAKDKLKKRVKEKKELIQGDNPSPLLLPDPPTSGKRNPRKKKPRPPTSGKRNPRKKKPRPPRSGNRNSREERLDEAEETLNKISSLNLSAMLRSLNDPTYTVGKPVGKPLEAW